MEKVKKIKKIENKVKVTNDTTPIRELSNSATWLDYMNPDADRFFPEKDSWRKKLCYTLHIWSLKNDALEIQQFCDEYKMSYQALISMVQRYEDIASAYADVKRRIAARKRIGAAHNKLNITVFKDIHRYDPEWIPLMKELEDIKKDSGQNTRQVIVLEGFGNGEDDK
jgi:hypothetical protein